MAEGKTVSSGNISMLLLQLLSEKDMYGYEMIEELEKRSEYVFSLKAGTMYPLLHAMESKKHLVSYEKEAQGKVRRYYTITKQGRAELLKKKEAWETYAKAVGQVIGGALYGNA
ncbi:MAG: PadR family transcriptional regulator [Enterocloster aldenensis]|uniref:PadR family transcriptional regulator n=1 Tax=Enterocloster aldenensis TaxID=358742 RepID=UPI000E504D7B|nr:PadR family transcriptional regulator [Enterocloster aldenensis]RHB37939.1 PadR family transcriptional regulator [Enterocloster aldenensis]